MDVSTFVDPVVPHYVDPDAAAPEKHGFTFQFTGTGREYFRIWVINLLLGLATLGVYSAWAKVRRLEYFDRNTILAGAAFDFHGNPKAILRGRVLAVLLLAAYHYAFGFSLAFGLCVAGVLLLALPYMMRGALRFRLGNTSWRGLRFHFSGSPALAYRTYLPPVAVFLLPGVVAAVSGDARLSTLSFVLYLGWPAMHGWMKRYQYGHAAYGSLRSSTTLALSDFYGIYVRGLLLATTIVLVVFALSFASLPLRIVAGERLAAGLLGMASALSAALMAYVLLGPYQQVRVLNLCLSNSAFPGVRFVSTLSARGYIRLQLKNLALTLLTLGLYRPFAVVSAYRYRLAHLMLEVDGSVDDVLTGVHVAGSAVGDGSADLLGIDLSW